MFFEQRCAVCGDAQAIVCRRCAATMPLAFNAPGSAKRSAVVLDERSREVVAALKYRRERRVARFMAAAMVALVPSGADVITWVPATPGRARRRGFDHGEVLARLIARQTGVRPARVLARARDDRRQTEGDIDARHRGPAVRPLRAVAGLVVLVDDITTTGASLERCRQHLEACGADRVIGVTFAATPRRRAPGPSSPSDR